MNQAQIETIQAWTAALRSGEYKQGKGCLARKQEDHDSYCCLGVLMDLKEVKREEEVPRVGDPYLFTMRSTVGEPTVSGLIPIEQFFDWTGLGGRAVRDSLADQNDNGESFSEIARQIEGYAIGRVIEGISWALAD